MPENQPISSGRLLEAVHILAASQLAGGGPEGPSTQEELAAIQVLRGAPPLDHWDRGLLGGLRCRRREVADAAVQAVIERMGSPRDAEAEDRFLSAVLDACFLNLSGRSRLQAGDEEARRADDHEETAARLVREVTHLLRDRPFELEHHRSRLLAWARRLEHLEGRGTLAQAVVEFQAALARGGRSDSLAAADLLQHRKLDLYTSPLTTAPTLLAYLELDRSLPVGEVSRELFQAYRMMLACQNPQRAGRAMAEALANLGRWLDETPQTSAAREELFAEVVRRARVRVPREDLDLRVCRQLEAHLELLPGPDHPEDLLRQLASRFDSHGGEEILIRGLDVLRRLPLLRLRSAEIAQLVLRPGGRWRSAAVWQAFLRLLESLATGLADFVLTREPLERREQSRLRLLRQLLSHDRELRVLLYRMATDPGLCLSHDAEVERQTREGAWRVLLRCLPPDRAELLREGLLGRDGRYFFATLEEAGRAHQREVWEILLSHWDELVEAGRPAEERRARLRALSGFFRQTREYTAVQDRGDALGPWMRLAFDDADPEVRELAEAALVETGYALEVERERQRRLLLHLRDSLTASNERVVALEGEIARIASAAVETQVQRAGEGLAVQELLQDRDLQITEGWIVTSALQVDLEEVRVELMEAIAAAEEELRLLRGLQRQMAQEHAEARQIHGVVERLVGEQQEQEREVQRLRAARDRAESSLAAARREQEEARSRRSYLQSHPPSRPSDTGDAERNAQLRREWEGKRNAHQSELHALSERIDRARGEIASAEKQVQSCERGIRKAEAEVRRLQGEIDRQRSRIEDLRHRISSLARELAVHQATCEALRQEIRVLTDRVEGLRRRLESQRARMRSEIGSNTAAIEGRQASLERIHEQLQTLSTRLNQTGHALDQQRTDSQRLIQALDSGRESYDRIAGDADSRSALADAEGASRQRAFEQETLAAQEGFVQYTEGMHHALIGEPPSPTRQERRRRRSPEKQEKRLQ